jgi:hypothetical protein
MVKGNTESQLRQQLKFRASTEHHVLATNKDLCILSPYLNCYHCLLFVLCLTIDLIQNINWKTVCGLAAHLD